MEEKSGIKRWLYLRLRKYTVHGQRKMPEKMGELYEKREYPY